jgi:hypothetical protein
MKMLNINRILAALVLVTALITLFSTVSPSVSFWDPGERIAASYLVQVPHPPGAPLFILAGRVLSMVPLAGDIAFRVNTISVLAGSFTVLLLYLMLVKLITYFRGTPESLHDQIITYGSAIIGSLSLLWSQTFWFNATEAETYATSLFLMILVVWLGMVWYDRAEQKGSETYLLLGAYVIGLSVGVHLLSLLAFFPVALIVYYRKFEPEWSSFIKYGMGVVATFFVIYPGIIKWFPSMLDGNLVIGNFVSIRESQLLQITPWIIIALAVYGVYYSTKMQKRYLNIALLTFLLIAFGFTTYTSVLMRSNANPPMNQNQPDNIRSLVSYLNREQYGEVPLFDRRWSPEEAHQMNYRKYTSDFDYVLKYQIYHMYVRYLFHNFIGRDADVQDATYDWRRLYALPFLLGLLGVYYHIRRDWKWGTVFLGFFLITGFALAFYFNMTEPQPRERDYFYAGSFFVFAAWIGLGATALLETVSNALAGKTLFRIPAIVGVAVLLFIASPINLFTENKFERDRSGHYIAWDYAYNLLQSVEEDGILFTNGDNDTFPLWYLQDVEGIRQDVRVVNLSLLNTSWYINQLKHQQPHGAKPVPISLTDPQVNQIRPMQWEPRDLEMTVPEEVYDRYDIVDPPTRSEGKIRWRMPNTRDFNGIPVIRVQDIMVRDIVMTAGWDRPVYFAITIPDNGSKIGLDPYLRLEGLVQRVTPIHDPSGRSIGADILNANLFEEPEEFSRDHQYGYKFRGLNDPSVYLEEQSRRLTINYRNSFLQLAYHYQQVLRDDERTIAVLDRMEEAIPRNNVEMFSGMKYEIANFYRRSGREDKYSEITDELITELQKDIQDNPHIPINVRENPYLVLMFIYSERGEFRNERDLLNRMLDVYGDQPTIVQQLQQRIDQISAHLREDEEIEPVDTTIIPESRPEN